MAVAELDREEVFGIRFAIVSDADGETNFRLPTTLLNLRCLVSNRQAWKPVCRDSLDGYLSFNLVTFVTVLTFLLQCHSTTLNFRIKDRLGSQCAGEHKWLSSFFSL